MIRRWWAAALILAASFAGCHGGAVNEARTVTASPDAAPAPVALVVDSGVSDALIDAPSAQDGFTLAAIVADERGAYWFGNVHDLLTQKPSGEGSPKTLAKADGQPVALALGADRVYWVENDAVVSVARADGTKKVLAKLARPRGLVLDGSSALVVADDTDASSAIYRVPLDGGAAVQIAAVPVGTATLAADDASIFVVTEEVLRIPKAGGAAKKVSGSPEAAQAIVLVRGDIVFIGSDPQAMTGRVWRMSKRGPAPPPKRAPGDDSLTMVMYAGAAPVSGEGGSVTALATDGRRPFWIRSADDPDVKIASLETANAKGEPVEVAKVPSPSGLTVFRSRLYWSTPAGVKSMPVPAP